MKAFLAVLLLCSSCTAIFPDKYYVIVGDKVKTPLDGPATYILVLTDGNQVRLARCSKEFYMKTNRFDTLYNIKLKR